MPLTERGLKLFQYTKREDVFECVTASILANRSTEAGPQNIPDKLDQKTQEWTPHLACK
jgi:hypothetical protein